MNSFHPCRKPRPRAGFVRNEPDPTRYSESSPATAPDALTPASGLSGRDSSFATATWWHMPKPGFRVIGITSRSIDKAREVASTAGRARVFESVEEMLDDPAIEVVDIAVPPNDQPA